MKHARRLGCLLLFPLLLAGAAHADPDAKERRQIVLFGFGGKHVTISINSTKILDEPVKENLGFLFRDIEPRFKLDIVADNSQYHGDFTIDDKVKGFKITNGAPITVEPVDYLQGED